MFIKWRLLLVLILFNFILALTYTRLVLVFFSLQYDFTTINII